MKPPDHIPSDLGDDDDNEDDVNESSPLLNTKRQPPEDSPSTTRNGHAPNALLERPEAYRSRWRSIRLMYLVMFLGSVTFTITMSSLWPFLQVLNPASTASFLGWVVAAYSLGQLVASPIFGGWANLRGSSREPLTISLLLTALSSVFYVYLESLPWHREYFMILARGLIGFSAGNTAVVRSYLAGATTVQERTACMANLSICQAMGFILGPVIQAALVPISYPGPVHSVYFHFNMYTAPALLAGCVATISLNLLVFVFREHRVYDDDIRDVLQGRSGGDDDDEESPGTDVKDLTDSLKQLQYKVDYVAVFSCILLFFGVLFMFTVFETIATPLTMDMYAWTKSKATLYQGLILGVAGVVSIIVFMIVKLLAKREVVQLADLTRRNAIKTKESNAYVEKSSAPARVFNTNEGHNPKDAVVLTDHDILRREVNVKNRDEEFVESFHMPAVYEKLNGAGDFAGGHDGQAKMVSVDSDGWGGQEGRGEFTLPETAAATTTSISASSSTTTTTAAIIETTVKTKTTAATTSTESSLTTTSNLATNSTDNPANGCPWQYQWCRHVPALYLAQFLGGTALISIGYPVCNMLSYTLYSKVLGPKPQGLWMGWLTASGSLARAVGPVYVSQVYDSFGPQITFGSCSGFIAFIIIYYLLVFRRMVPFSLKRSFVTPSADTTSKIIVN